LTLPFPALPGRVPAAAFAFAFAALAAATTLSRFPLLGFLFGPLFLAPVMVVSLSTRLRNGLGRFSSSEKSYSGAGGDDCGTATDFLGAVEATAADDDGRLEETMFDRGAGDDNPVGSDVEAGSPGCWTDRRIDGRRRREGGAPADDSRCFIDFDSVFARSRKEGEGGGPSTSESSSP